MEKNNIKKEVKEFKNLPDCFIKKGNRYNPQVKALNLPVVPAKYTDVLDKWGIEYEYYEIEKKGETLGYCRYWDRSHFEEREVELPAYEYRLGRFVYAGNHTGLLPTETTVKYAFKLKQKVDSDILKIRTKDKVAYLRYCMQGRSAAYFDSMEFKAPFDEGDLDNFCIFKLKKNNTSSHLIVFDYNRIYDEDVTLFLPEEYLQEIIGEDEENAERWLKVLKIDTIRIETY